MNITSFSIRENFVEVGKGSYLTNNLPFAWKTLSMNCGTICFRLQPTTTHKQSNLRLIHKSRLALWVVYANVYYPESQYTAYYPVLCIRKRAKKVFEMHLDVSPLELPMAHCKLSHNQKYERFSLKLSLKLYFRRTRYYSTTRVARMNAK